MSSVNGSKELQAAFKALGAKFEREIKAEVGVITSEILFSAKRDAPGPGDQIRTESGSENQQQIARGRSWTPISQALSSKLSPDGLSGTVFVEKSAGDIAVWVEMGTGQSAKSYLLTVDPEWRTIAQKYYVNGKGTIINQPYLYNNYLKYRAEFLKNVKSLIANTKL